VLELRGEKKNPFLKMKQYGTFQQQLPRLGNDMEIRMQS